MAPALLIQGVEFGKKLGFGACVPCRRPPHLQKQKQRKQRPPAVAPLQVMPPTRHLHDPSFVAIPGDTRRAYAALDEILIKYRCHRVDSLLPGNNIMGSIHKDVESIGLVCWWRCFEFMDHLPNTHDYRTALKACAALDQRQNEATQAPLWRLVCCGLCATRQGCDVRDRLVLDVPAVHALLDEWESAIHTTGRGYDVVVLMRIMHHTSVALDAVYA